MIVDSFPFFQELDLLEVRLTVMDPVEEQFLPFSQALLAHTYQAYSPDDIITFIREVVIGGNDFGKAERDTFAAQMVCVNHPHAADAVVKSVIEALVGEDLRSSVPTRSSDRESLIQFERGGAHLRRREVRPD